MRTRRRAERRCLVAGCARAAQRGRAVCADHRRTAVGKEAEMAVRRVAAGMAQEAEEAERERAMAAFRKRLERGDYGALFDERVRTILRQASDAEGFRDELGAVRFALAKLLAEETDADRLALGVSRLVTTATRVARIWSPTEGKSPWELAHQIAEGLVEDRVMTKRGWVWKGAGVEWVKDPEAARARMARWEERKARDGDGGTRDTNAQAVKEWRARQEQEQERSGPTGDGLAKDEGSGVGREIDYGVPWDGNEETIVDAFSELRPGGWRYELAEGASDSDPELEI